MTTAAHAIAFIDSRVADYQTLIDGLAEGTEWFLLDGGYDGLGQMAKILSGYSNLDAIHVFSHGSPGALYLGRTVLNAGNLDAYLTPLQIIGSSLTATGDILLYGCNVGEGDGGQNFIAQLATYTGADIAASINPTGASLLGGNWALEVSTGTVEAEPLPASNVQFAFSGLLAPTSVSNGFRHPLGDGSLWTESNDGDGYYVYPGQNFNDPVTFSNGNKSYHLGEDWNAEGREDRGDPVYAASNGEVVAVVGNQGSSTTGFGNYVVIRHDLPHSELINGKMVSSVYSLYAHLDTTSVSIGEIVSLGYQLGTVGDSGYSEGPHLHFEITLAPTLPTSDDGYNPLGAPDAWVDPGDFINQHQTLGSTHSVSISDAQITEGNTGTQTMTFTVTRVGGTEAFDVSYATVDGTAAATDGDYLAASGTLHFDADVDTQTIAVTIKGDTTDTTNENFYVKLAGATNGVSVSDGSAVGTIVNDDSGVNGLGLVSTPITSSYPGKAPGEFRNINSFAAILSDGSVVTWHPLGDRDHTAFSVANQLDGTVDVTQIFSARNAFAALRADGSVVTWQDGISGNEGGDSSAVANQLDGTVDVTQIFSTRSAFAALRADGSVVTWGGSGVTWGSGGDSSAVASQLDGTVDVTQIFSTVSAFAALRADGSVVTWGNSSAGGDSSAVASQLNGTVDVAQIFSTGGAFAALRADGTVVTWGDGDGGDSSAVASQINGAVDVAQIFSTGGAFAALRADGSVVTWGSSGGGDSSAVASQLDGTVDVTQIFSTGGAFAALRADGSVVTWGSTFGGGNSNAVANQLNGTVDVTQIFSTNKDFAALREDGSVVTWGYYGSYIGISNAVLSQLDGSVDVIQISSTDEAFAALRADGSVVTWGNSSAGGDSSAVASQVNGTVNVTQIFSTAGAFAALREDGSVVMWGNTLNNGVNPQLLDPKSVDGSNDVVQVCISTSGFAGAFAALRADGSVVTWGYGSYGGNSSAVASQLDGSIDVTQLFSTFSGSFAALRGDGSVVTWGGSGSNSSAVASKLDGTVDVKQVCSSEGAFAALRSDGSVATWGDSNFGGDSSAVASQLDGTINVTQLFSTNFGFAALRADGSVVTWGNSGGGGDSSAVASQLNGTVDVTQIFSGYRVFAALRADGSVVTWGGSGSNSSAVASQLDGTVDVTQIFSTRGRDSWGVSASAALREDGSVVTWGGSGGGDSRGVASQLDGTVDVTQIFFTEDAFAALRADGSVVTWGGSGGNSSAVANQLDGTVDVTQIISTGNAFAALRADGSVVTWGGSGGGDSSAVASQINGAVDVAQIFSTGGAFAALRADGSVVTWGSSDGGGDSSAVANQLDGTVDVIHIYSNGAAFAALRADGSVVTWGNPYAGGYSDGVADELDGTINVVQIFSDDYFGGNGGAFAALREDGSLVTWGDMLFGGGGLSYNLASKLDGTMDVVWMANPFTDDIFNAVSPDTSDDYADEATDTTAPIGILSLGSSITGNIGLADSNDTYGDKDVFKVLLTQGETYAIHLKSTLVDGQALPQGLFTIRDGASFNTILDTSAIGADVTENFTAGTTGHYFIRVGTGGAATDQGGYQLSVNSLAPANRPPTASGIDQVLAPGESKSLDELFDWSDPDGLADVISFAVRDRDIGGGYLTANGVRLPDGQLFDNIPISEIANWAFVAGDAGSLDDVAFNAIDAAGAFNTTAAISTVTSSAILPPPVKPSEMILEYFAKGLAYDDRVLGGEKELASIEAAWGASFGYKIDKVFHNGTFLAVGLTGENKEPILAIRGTDLIAIDWYEDFDPRGVGYSEFYGAWKYTELRQWLTDHPGANLTGHSQGGAQAQLLAAEATADAISIGSLLTFNSPGIGPVEAGKFNSSYAGTVKHVISSGDLVELAGIRYIPGDVFRYNFNTFDLIRPWSQVYYAHTQHWSDQDLYGSQFDDGRKPALGYQDFTNTLSFEEYQLPTFSFLYSGLEFDKEYFGFLLEVSAVATPTVAAALSSRIGVEAIRTDLGVILKTIEVVVNLPTLIQDAIRAAMQAVHESGAKAWEAVSQWEADAWDEVKDWTSATWEKTVGLSAAVWHATVDGTTALFNAIENSAVEVVNATIDTLNSIDPATQTTTPPFEAWDAFTNWIGSWEFFSSHTVEVIAPTSGIASASAGTSTVFFGGSSDETLVGGSADDLFLGGDGTNTQVLWRAGSSGNILAQGHDAIIGTPAELDGDTVFGFATDDAIFVAGALFTMDDVSVARGSAIIQVDVDQDGAKDFTLTLKGEYQLDEFVVESQETGTVIRYVGSLGPVLADDGGEGFDTSADTAFTTASVFENDRPFSGRELEIVSVDASTMLGKLTDNGNGTFTYDPDGAFTQLAKGEGATETFRYTARDETGLTAEAEVTITVNGVDKKPVINLIAGSAGSDYLIGTENADAIRSLAGLYDRMTGGGGADQFIFGAEAMNGIRERDLILDYEVGIDSIVLEDGATVGSIRQTSSSVVVFLEGDGDAIYVRGEGVTAENLRIVGVPEFDFINVI